EASVVVFGDFVYVIGLAAHFQERYDAFDLFIGHEWAMDARDAASTRHIEHVTPAQKLLGATFAEDRPAVDLRGHLKADPGRKVGFNCAGDDVDRRALGRHDKVDPGGA